MTWRTVYCGSSWMIPTGNQTVVKRPVVATGVAPPYLQNHGGRGKEGGACCRQVPHGGGNSRDTPLGDVAGATRGLQVLVHLLVQKLHSSRCAMFVLRFPGARARCEVFEVWHHLSSARSLYVCGVEGP